MVLIDCEKCQAEKECEKEKKVEVQRRQLFALYSAPATACGEYEPLRWRGIEGVAA